jgi:hypothetical protein
LLFWSAILPESRTLVCADRLLAAARLAARDCRISPLPNCASSYCSAAIAPRRAGDIGKKMNQINELDGYDAILTWLDALSMVRAAFEGDGA